MTRPEPVSFGVSPRTTRHTVAVKKELRLIRIPTRSVTRCEIQCSTATSRDRSIRSASQANRRAFRNINGYSAAPNVPSAPNTRERSVCPRVTSRSWFVPCLQEAEIEGYVWHCSRHTFCSWLAMAGASIKDIQELAGHKTITMSARYSHLSPEHRLSVIDRISSRQEEVSSR